MITPKFNCKNKSGRLFITEHEQLVAYLQGLPEDVEMIVRAKSKHQLRSDNQNRYFHGPLLDALVDHFNELGYTREEVKDIIKYKFLKETKVINHPDGTVEEIEHIKPTSALSTAEFESFLSSVRMWASELGCWIPEPNEESNG
jgi:hypothetical protein